MKFSARHIAALALMLAASAPIAVCAAEAPAQEIAATAAPQVSVRQGQVVVEIAGDAACHVAVYSLTGQVVRQLDAAPGVTHIDLPAGHYVVRVGATSVKVVVK